MEREIFDAALPIQDDTARQAYLEEACAGDEALRQRVEALLKAHEGASGFLQRLVFPEVAPGDAPDTTCDPSERFKGVGRGDLAHTERFDSSRDRVPLTEEKEDEPSLDFLQPSDRPDSLGRLAHYEVLQVLGAGSFGTVVKAFDEKLHRLVAIKVIARALGATSPPRKRFLREARAAAAVRHENVVDIHAVDDLPIPHLVMEYVAGETLQQKLDRVGPLAVPDVVRIGHQIASGLAAAHRQGLIHRDIKPANILLEGGLERVKITDFGLARAADDASPMQSALIAGTPMYMAPEQALGASIDQRADLFSLGSVLYVMCSGRPPFRATNLMAVLKRVVEDTPRPIREIIPEVPEWLCDLIAWLHAKNPADRPSSAQEVADLLGNALEDLRSGRRPAAIPISARPARDTFGSASGETVSRPLGVRARSAGRRWVVAASLLLTLSVGLGLAEASGVADVRGAVIRLFFPDGTLVVEVDDPGVSVRIDGSDMVITGAGVKEIRVKPGDYKVVASKDGRVVQQELVTVERNGRRVIRVTKEAAAVVAKGKLEGDSAPQVRDAPETDKWKVVFSDKFDRDQVGDRWVVARGEWMVEDGALKGKLRTRQGQYRDADIALRETEIPTTVEVRYDTWSPDEVGSAAQFRSEADDGAVVMSFLGVEHTAYKEKGANVLVQQQRRFLRVGSDKEAELVPKVRHKVRLVRKGDGVTSFLDGKQVVSADVSSANNLRDLMLHLQGTFGKEGSVIYFDNLEVRVPPDQVKLEIPLAPQHPDASETDQWKVVVSDTFDRAEIGDRWTVAGGEWTIEDGAVKGKLLMNDVAGIGYHWAGIKLRETEIPTTVEVRYETWSPDEIGSETRFVTEAGAGIVMSFMGALHPAYQEKGAMLYFVEQGKYSRVSANKEAEFTPKVRHKVRLVRKGDHVTLCLDGKVAVSADVSSAKDLRDLGLLLQGTTGKEGSFVYFDNFEIRVPPDQAKVGIPLAPQRPAAPETDKWKVVVSDTFDRGQVGDRWTVTRGEWTVEDGALKGQLHKKSAQGNYRDADIILRETALPTTCEVRYETWSPGEIGTEAKYLVKTADAGIVAAFLGKKHPIYKEKGAMLYVLQQGTFTPVGWDREAVFTPKVRHKVRIVREEDRMRLFFDGKEVVSADVSAAKDLRDLTLHLQGTFGNEGSVIYFDNLEIRVPPDQVKVAIPLDPSAPRRPGNRQVEGRLFRQVRPRPNRRPLAGHTRRVVGRGRGAPRKASHEKG